MHDLSLISTVAAAFTAAWVLGLITQRLGLSPIVGYLLAGVLIGPHTPGFVGDAHIAQQLAEVGVILLMFGVGLHFHLKDLLAVKDVAIAGAVGQSLVATVCTMLLFHSFGFSLTTGAVIGMAMSVASTVVLMRVLMDADMLHSQPGHVAVGWLIVEDIFTVILLVLIPVLGQQQSNGESVVGLGLWKALGISLLRLAALVAVVLLAGSRIVPWILVRVARLRSRELFTLTVLVFSIAIAAGSYYIFGASMALGAFLAGMVVAQSPVSHQAAADALPMRDAFAVLFFVSVGMLLDPAFLIQQPLMILAALGVILLIKPLVALAIVALVGHSVRTALTVALGLAQIGEFSFILSDLARRHGLMPESGHNVLVAAAIVSITLNPWLFRSLPKVEAWLKKRPRLWRLLNSRAEKRAAGKHASAAALDHGAVPPGAVVVGYGPVGRSVNRMLRDANISTVVVDLNAETAIALNKEGQPAIYGDASRVDILEQAGLLTASHLVVTLPEPSDRAAVVTAGKSLNPNLRVLVRARYLNERETLDQLGATAAVFEEAEAAVALGRLVLADAGLRRQAAEQKIKDLRLQLILENVSNIQAQRVRSVMVPWTSVRTLRDDMSREAVLNRVSQERFSRWPVVDPGTQRASGYLLAKDLVASATQSDWKGVIRPVSSIHPDDSIETALTRMQRENASLYVVQTGEQVVGLITLEDILEQVVGRLEDEYVHEPAVSLLDAIERGAIVQDVLAQSRTAIIEELVRTIPRSSLALKFNHAELVKMVLAREAQVSTNLGNQVALPHARCPGLGTALVVVGRLREATAFDGDAAEPVRLVFLLLTPAEQPETQLALLAQIAHLVSEPARRDELIRAANPAEVLAIVAREDRHRATGGAGRAVVA